MLIRKISGAVAAASLAIAPVAAQAAPRASAPVSEESDIAGLEGFDLVFIALVLAIVIWAIIENTDDSVSA